MEVGQSTQVPLWRMFQELVAASPNKNLVFSPSSLEQMLGMLYLGADGKTAIELEDILYAGNRNRDENIRSGSELIRILKGLQRSKPRTRFYVKNSVNVSETFVRQADEMLDTEVDQNNNLKNPASTAKIIDSWVREIIRGRAHQPVPEGIFQIEEEKERIAILVNVSKMRTAWQKTFAGHTIEQFTAKERKKSVKMDVIMMSLKEEFFYANVDDLTSQVVRIKYEVYFLDLSMVIILPRKGIDVHDIVKRFTLEKWNAMRSTLKNALLQLSIPRFSAPYACSGIQQILSEKFGLTVFSGGKAAPNFTRMTSNSNFSITQITQVISLTVFEGATWIKKAGYKRGNRGPNSSSKKEATDFVCNRPFLFVIEMDWRPLFMGRILKPDPVPDEYYEEKSKSKFSRD